MVKNTLPAGLDGKRSTAVGKKNWLFVGGEDTGDRSAVIYTLLESARRNGHEPYAYLRDVLERLPDTTTAGLDALLPVNWKPAGQTTVTLLAAG
ncbi:transposase domain-containing protein [Luteolibacter yonseiensis]|uniref:Transposase domain-containing protein n=1 Tax=Luteolibacter yonseiensis TaxID=1144680 RepID=A0A934R4D9_9BACT|nr:transposase domain-containing protein [Luteolibacter yonseiensis]